MTTKFEQLHDIDASDHISSSFSRCICPILTESSISKMGIAGVCCFRDTHKSLRDQKGGNFKIYDKVLIYIAEKLSTFKLLLSTNIKALRDLLSFWSL